MDRGVLGQTVLISHCNQYEPGIEVKQGNIMDALFLMVVYRCWAYTAKRIVKLWLTLQMWYEEEILKL